MAAAVDARWHALYAASRPTLYRAAVLLVGEAEAEEVVQDAFERAMREPDFFGRVREPLAWLRTVSTRVALARLRRRAVWERAKGLLRRDGAVEAPTGDVADAVRRLPPKQRAAVVLRYYHDAPYSEIAQALEMDMASVGPLLTRARAALREALK